MYVGRALTVKDSHAGAGIVEFSGTASTNPSYSHILVTRCYTTHVESYQMFDFMHEDCLSVLSMPTPVAASTDQETSRRIDHCKATSASVGHRNGSIRLTHLRNVAAVMSRNNLELYSTLHLAIDVRLSCLCNVP